MSHLTDDQLSARLDEALAAAASAQADAHLAQCEACRARLAELGANDAALATALTHDRLEAILVEAGLAPGSARAAVLVGAALVATPFMIGIARRIAAAFNTPLGGIVFAFEQLTRRRGVAHSALVVAAIVLAGLVAVSVFGNHTYFGRLRVETLSWAMLGPGLLVAVSSVLAGGLFSRLLVTSLSPGPDRLHLWRSRHPLRFAAGCALAVAVFGFVADGTTAGAGYAPTRALLDGQDSPGPLYTGLSSSCRHLAVRLERRARRRVRAVAGHRRRHRT